MKPLEYHTDWIKPKMSKYHAGHIYIMIIPNSYTATKTDYVDSADMTTRCQRVQTGDLILCFA